MGDYSMFYVGPGSVFYDVAADVQKQDAEHWAVMEDTSGKTFSLNTTTQTKEWPATVTSPYIRCGFTNWRTAAIVVWLLNHPAV